jgi:hypothetical protein
VTDALPKAELPGLILSAETELGITAGLQDRVIQVYEGMVYMVRPASRISPILRLHGCMNTQLALVGLTATPRRVVRAERST